MEYKLQELKNGMRIVYRPNFTRGITHCCMIIQVGSREDPLTQSGMVHFMEHMLFKGTKTKTNRQILNYLELVGGEINAYTTKEYMCLYASFPDSYLGRALSLFKDILVNSNFPFQEIQREKEVIGDEIDSYKDIPEEYIYDEFEAQVFKNHPLGFNILGSKESIQGFSREDFFTFKEKYFRGGNMVFGLYTSAPLATWTGKIAVAFEEIPSGIFPHPRIKPNPEILDNEIQKMNIHQVHGIIGGRSFSIHNEERLPMLLLINLLGGPGMSSLLNLEIREKRGICYQIEANYTPLSDSGIFSIYFGTDLDKYEKCIDLIYREINKIRSKGISSLYLHQSKARFKGQIALAEENHCSVIISICKSIQDYEKADSLLDVFKKIDKISPKEITDVAETQFNADKLSSLILKPID